MSTIIQGEAMQMLGVLKGADMNSTGDNIIPITAARYIVRKIVFTNASVSLTTAVGGFYSAAAKGGTPLVTNAQVYSFLTAAAKFLDVALLAILTTDVRTDANLYLSLTVAQGAPATADVYIFGDVLP